MSMCSNCHCSSGVVPDKGKDIKSKLEDKVQGAHPLDEETDSLSNPKIMEILQKKIKMENESMKVSVQMRNYQSVTLSQIMCTSTIPPIQISSIQTKFLTGRSSLNSQSAQRHKAKCSIDISTQYTQFGETTSANMPNLEVVKIVNQIEGG